MFRSRFLLLVGLVALAADGDDRTGDPRRRALLIGIGRYRENQPARLDDLRGPANDVRELARILIERERFRHEDVVTLVDASATRERIASAFEQLARQAGARDVVYVHFSSHAVQLPDDDGDEIDDDADEAIVPFGNGPIEQIALRDDLLQQWLDALPTPNVLVVVDTCHAAGVLRGAANVVASPPFKQLALATQRVLMAASGTHEQALDGDTSDRARGYFSFALGRALETTTATVTVAEFWERVLLELAKLELEHPTEKVPDPELDANPARRSGLLFSDLPAVGLRRRAFPASVRGAELFIDAPQEQIPLRASRFELFRFDERGWVAGRGLATARRVTPGTDLRRARIEGASGGLPRRVWVVPVDVTRPLRLAWDNSSRDPALERIRVTLEQSRPGLFASDPRDVAALTMRVTREPGARSGVNAEIRMLDGTVVVTSLSADSAERIAADLLTWLPNDWGATSLLALLRQVAPQAELEVRLASPQSPRDTGRDATGTVGSNAEVALQIRSGERRYLTVVSIDGLGRVNALFPNAHSNAMARPRGVTAIPGATWTQLPSQGDEQQIDPFIWRFDDPVAPETVLVFASPTAAAACAVRRALTEIGADFARATHGVQPCAVAKSDPTTAVTTLVVPIAR